jgi:hypothetical protein
MSIFSVLNSPKDISFSEKYGEMCGLSEEEILRCFPEHIEAAARKMNLDPDALLDKMRAYYDGFCFDGVHRLYNPFSTLNFFDEKRFLNFWMRSGSSKLIGDYLKARSLTVEQFRNIPVSEDFANEPGDMNSIPPEGFLYQTGYLSLREGTIGDYALDYPNTEVLNAMSELLARNILPAHNSFGNLQSALFSSMIKHKLDALTTALNALLASIPYDDFAAAGKLNIDVNDYPFSVQEWLYRSTIFAFLRGCGVVVIAEMHTNLGRPDLVVSHKGHTYVIELKVAYEPKDIPAKLAEAVRQMKLKNYLAPYPGATGLAIVIDDTKRQISDGGYTAVKR